MNHLFNLRRAVRQPRAAEMRPRSLPPFVCQNFRPDSSLTRIHAAGSLLVRARAHERSCANAARPLDSWVLGRSQHPTGVYTSISREIMRKLVRTLLSVRFTNNFARVSRPLIPTQNNSDNAARYAAGSGACVVMTQSMPLFFTRRVTPFSFSMHN